MKCVGALLWVTELGLSAELARIRLFRFLRQSDSNFLSSFLSRINSSGAVSDLCNIPRLLPFLAVVEPSLPLPLLPLMPGMRVLEYGFVLLPLLILMLDAYGLQ